MAKKRTVTCGKCKGKGHNARSCTVSAEGGVKKGPLTETTVELPDPPKKRTRIDTRERPRREAPTADKGTAATAAPYRCVKCNSVAILAIVRVKDHAASFKKGKEIFMGEMRCEQCLNKPNPAELILKWGAQPGEKITAEAANA